MADISLETINSSIKLIKEIKDLYAPQNPYLPIYSALGGAFIGAVAGFIPSAITSWMKDKRDRKVITYQLYAEIKAIMKIIKIRQYANDLKQIIHNFQLGKISSHTYQIQVQDDRFPIYKNSLKNLGLLNEKLQIPLVDFYQTLEAIIQDVKPGGILNVTPVGVNEFSEVLVLVERVEELAKEIMDIIQREYSIE